MMKDPADQVPLLETTPQRMMTLQIKMPQKNPIMRTFLPS
jgi:hypothetical protein